MMLSTSEYTCGQIAEASPPAIIFPRTEHEQILILGTMSDRKIAVFIGDNYRFECFDYDSGSNWAGLIIDKISIEVDEGTIFDPNETSAPLGALLREKTYLCMRAKFDRSMGGAKICLVDNLPKITEGYSVGFLKWQVVIGQASEKRVLATIDLTQKAEK
jgi:hypothetical protein